MLNQSTNERDVVACIEMSLGDVRAEHTVKIIE